MVTVEIRINGTIISIVNATNRGYTDGNICRYEFQAVEFPLNNEGPATSKHGNITHKRVDGSKKLVLGLIKEMLK